MSTRIAPPHLNELRSGPALVSARGVVIQGMFSRLMVTILAESSRTILEIRIMIVLLETVIDSVLG